MEAAQPSAFVKCDSPAIAVRAAAAATAHQAGEAEADVGGDVGAHAKQFAHGGSGVGGWLQVFYPAPGEFVFRCG